MKSRPPTNRSERAAAALVAGVAGCSLLSGALLLFDGGPDLPRAALGRSTARGDPACAATDLHQRACNARIAGASTAAAASSATAPR